MWHVGAAIGTLVGAGLEYNHFCTDPLKQDERCLSLLADPHHASWAVLGGVLGGLSGLAYMAYEEWERNKRQ